MLLARKTSTPEVWQCDCEYSSRSATVPVDVLRLYYAEVIFIQPGGKVRHHVTMTLLVATRQQGWDVAVNLMVSAAGRCSRSHSQKHRNLQRENLQFTSCTEYPGFEHGYLPPGV